MVEVVRRTIQDQRPALDAADLSLNLILPAQPVWIVGDRTRLAQIITNILHNAVKFTEPKGRIDVQVTAEPDSAIISIRDTGIGMAPDMARAAFELFRQADNTLSRSRGGLGVGLSLAKGLVALHQGDIRAASEGLGKGSELTVRLPLTHPPEPPRDLPTSADGRIPGSRVLLVEDNVDAAESMRVLLELGGHHVEVVHNGKEALPLAREFHPEVVLCDIGLPGLDGYAVARAIREDPSVPTPHMIAITGYGRDEDVRLALEAGFDQHLTKPVDFARLDELLAQRT
jgi:CheY-like chemotaxis protein